MASRSLPSDAPKSAVTTSEPSAAFTPGPWHLCLHLSDPMTDTSCPCGYRGGIWGSDEEHVVCEMGSTEIKGEEGMCPPRYPRPVELANARLIAAAPDMWAAGTTLTSKYCASDFPAYMRDDWIALAAAISKATQP